MLHRFRQNLVTACSNEVDFQNINVSTHHFTNFYLKQLLIESLLFWKKLSVIEILGGRVRSEPIGGRTRIGEPIGGRYRKFETIGGVGTGFFRKTLKKRLKNPRFLLISQKKFACGAF